MGSNVVGRRLLFGGLVLVIVTASALGAWLVREHWAAPPEPTHAIVPTTAPDQAARLRRGRLLYQATCQTCHGAEGRGDGASTAEMKPPPRDFAEGPWKFGTSTEAVRKVIRDGIPKTSMPSSPSLSESDLDALTAYVLTFAPSSGRLAAAVREQLRTVGFTPIDPPREAPPLELLDLDGKAISLTQFRGRAVLVNFWGTDCVHCLAEMPHLQTLAEDFRDLVVLPICFDETDRELVGKTARQHAARLPVFVDPRGLAKSRYDAQVLPSTFLIDPQGRLIGSATGRHAWSRQELCRLLTALGIDVGRPE